jgi:hypothetical protein
VVRLWWASVANGIRDDPRGCVYGSVCGHRAHGVCGTKMGHTAWHMVPGHLLGSVCGHMHACVGLGWGARHGVWVSTGGVSWIDEDAGSLRGVNVTPDPIWMAHEWPMNAGVRV